MKKISGLIIFMMITNISFAKDLNIEGTWVSIKNYKEFMQGSVSTIDESDIYPLMFDVIKNGDDFECKLKKSSSDNTKLDAIFSGLYEYTKLEKSGENQYELTNIDNGIKFIFSFGEKITEIPTYTTGKKTFIKHKEKNYFFNLLFKDEIIGNELPLYPYNEVLRNLKNKAEVQNMQQYKPLERRKKDRN